MASETDTDEDYQEDIEALRSTIAQPGTFVGRIRFDPPLQFGSVVDGTVAHVEVTVEHGIFADGGTLIDPPLHHLRSVIDGATAPIVIVEHGEFADGTVCKFVSVLDPNGEVRSLFMAEDINPP